MKTILTILAVLAFATAAQAQTVVLDYDMSMTPGQQGFSINNSCGTEWNATGTVLEYRGCTTGIAAAFAAYNGLLTGAATVQIDMRMRILDSVGYAFDVIAGRGDRGYYFQLDAADLNNDTEWHDVTFFIDFVPGVRQAYVDGILTSVDNASYNHDMFVIGDGNSSGTWGNVDIASLVVTVDRIEPVADEPANWSGLKSLYR